ncbi:hypothetical protein TRFO_04946 [Tritrichomonas foetus]|uniref:TOG domain-containing protein n=1 Tax=Tritrichomonas foetus TaxID=1144522 RepID=A0A1J4KEY1_9EUKA|nr:hypothetical protein TRFO_04946 [Tritrichomonas foetus]|eukprot:OHT08324.1 hypothetical protein TRFO_04946 [Tritrichomonas foetus]
MTTNSPPIPTLRNRQQNVRQDYDFDHLDENAFPSQPRGTRNSPKQLDEFDENSIPPPRQNKVVYSPDNRPIKPSRTDGYPSPSQFDENLIFNKGRNATLPKNSRTRTTNTSSSQKTRSPKAAYDDLAETKESSPTFPKRKPQSPPKNTPQSPVLDENFDPFKRSSKIPNSPPIRGSAPIDNDYVIPTAGYDLDNLPSEAFQENIPVEEPEVVPRILSLTLPQRDSQQDSESDTAFTFSMTKEAALAAYSDFIDAATQKMIDSRVFKQRINGLNILQEKLEGIDDLSDLSLPVVRGLEKSPGWNQPNTIVHQLVIDILRHVVVKSENISKATVSLIIPYLIEKLSDRKLKTGITELLNIIAEALCPSFIVQQTCEICAKGAKSINKKTLATALDICSEIITLYGLGNINVNNLIPHLLKLLQHQTTEVKASSTTIVKYLYKEFGQPIEQCLSDLSGPILDRLKTEFQSSQSLPDPTKSYRRVSGSSKVQKINIKRSPLSKYVPNEDIENATTTKKWEDQKRFLDAVKNGLQRCKNSITSNDLDPIIRVFKTYLNDGNKNLVLKSLQLLEEIAKASDKGIAKEASVIASGTISAWSDQRANIREQATKTIDAFCVHSNPSVFIKAFAVTSFKPNSDTRLEIVKWLQSHVDEINQSDMEKIIPFVLQCVEDRSSITRQSGLQIAIVLRDSCPDAFDSALKILPDSSQREISKHFESAPTQAKQAPNSPERSKKVASKGSAAPANTDKAQQNAGDDKYLSKDKTLPRFVSVPTQGKKIKRLKQQQVNLGLAMIANKQMIATVQEKAKYDAQTIFPTTVFQKLFSTIATDQLDAITELKNIFSIDPQLICMCSDILVRWVAGKFFEKNNKVITEGVNFLMTVFHDDSVSIQEMEIIVPLVFWSVDSKPHQVVETTFDLLFVVRTHSDPTEYSTVLRSCIDMCNDKTLVHLFSELQFTVIDDPRNSTIFTEIIGFLEHKSDEVAAACGGVLALLARRMQPEVLSSIYDGLSPDKRDALSTVVPIEPTNTLNFDSFNRLASIEKIRICRRLLELLKTKLSMVQPNADMILEALLHELCCQDTDFTAMRLVLFSIHSMLMYCTIKDADLNRALQAVTFFGNRWQRKLVLLDGASIAQTINSILFKLFEKIPPATLFSLLLEGMSNFRGAIPADSFYCKCWVAIANQIEEMIQPGDSQRLIQFAREKHDEFGSDDVRGKLCNALIYTLSGKKKANESQQQQQQRQQTTREALARSLQRSPGKTINRDTPTSSIQTPTRNQESTKKSPERVPFESKFTSQRTTTTATTASTTTTTASTTRTTAGLTSSSTVSSRFITPSTSTTSTTGATSGTSTIASTTTTNTNSTTSGAAATGTTAVTGTTAARTRPTADSTQLLKQRLTMLKQRWG